MSSPPPPPPNPTTATTAATTTTATADFFKSVARQRPRKHSHPAIYQTFYNHHQQQPPTFPPPTQQRQQPPQQPPQQPLHSNLRTQHQQQSTAVGGGGGGGGILYPVASSGRGFLGNSDGCPPRPVSSSAYPPPYGVHRPPYGLLNSDVSGGQGSHLQQVFMGGGGGAVMPAVATGVSVSANPKVAGQTPVADDNILKNIRDKNGDDTLVIIRDRKVQVSEGTSLYAQCRSWLKNGFTLENQPQYVDCVKSLPKPLPATTVEARKEDDMEIEEKTEDIEQLSAKELLQQHVKHAKKVRVRLRNQRLQRIERYKDRLALLLPPVVDQPPKNDPTS